MKYLAIFALFYVAACQSDETVTAYTQGATVFRLVSIDDTAFPASATIDLTKAGKISGRGPCNSYFADQSVPYPWFDAGPIASTRMACPALNLETIFFEALGAMTLAETAGRTLILSTDTGREMVFQAP